MHQSEILTLLSRFDNLALQFPGKCLDSIFLSANISPAPTFTIVVALHGNEIGPVRQTVKCLDSRLPPT